MKLRFAIAFAMVLIIAGCGGGRRLQPGESPFAENAGAAGEIRIRIRNANFYDASVTVLGDTSRRRLGTVGGNQTATFTIPWEFSSGLRLQVDLLASASCTTDVIQANPGDDLQFEIPSDLSVSGFCGG